LWQIALNIQKQRPSQNAAFASMKLARKTKKCHLQKCKWHFDTRKTMRTSPVALILIFELYHLYVAPSMLKQQVIFE